MMRADFTYWSSLCVAVDATNAVRETCDALVSEYQAKERRYHNLEHIAQCLKAFDDLRTLSQAPQAVELAIWFHDIIYDSKAKDNEERSAERAGNDLTNMGGFGHVVSGSATTHPVDEA
jgi:predicted metal-dependent HD superfamily phosphohydrolase